MRGVIPWVVGLLVGLVNPAFARDKGPAFDPATAVLVVGEISSPPKVRLGEQKLQVAIGPERVDYTLHFFGAQVLGLTGRPLDEGDFRRGMWVRAEGRIMKDPRRVKVSRLQVIANDRAGLAGGAQLPPGLEQGFITSVAGTRQSFPEGAARTETATPVVIVGKLSEDFRSRAGASELTLRAAAAEWRMEAPEDVRITQLTAGKAGPPLLASGYWVRVCAWRRGDLRLRAARVDYIGNDAAYRASRFHRPSSPEGYVEAAGASELQRTVVRGTVRKIDTEQEYLIIRSADQRQHRIWLPVAEITLRSRSGDAAYLAGDEVEASILTFR